ncbi:MAG: hypothetical protein IKL65_00560 [Bacilli bacterium]|nr:hypothetical protein [Bacilli bacterium]MBR6689808.1 hypothetical protein [Bacilli bacterium]
MNGRISPLPHWVLTNYQSAFYDSESGTVLQAMARIYPKIEELITDYNDYVKQIDKIIKDFQSGIIKDFECFKNCIITTMTEYIESIDLKMSVQDSMITNKFEEQDEKINNAIDYMKNNIIETATSVINQAIENGELNVSFEYNPTTEELNFIVTREGDE